MTKLSSDIKSALSNSSTQEKTQGDTNVVQSQYSLDTPTQQITYDEFKEKWQARRVVELSHPYANQIELFLSLIEPEFNLEIQEAIALSIVNEEKLTGFVVKNSKVKFNWQLTDDRGDIFHGDKVHNPFAIKALYGPLNDHFTFLHSKNIRGSNPCIAINKIEGSTRINANVKSIRAIWLEDDEIRTKPRTAIDGENPLPLPPSFIVETSRGKFHYYWLTTTEDLHTWQRLQKEVMTQRLNSDPGANGLNRAMRIPGFWHSKSKPFPTRIIFLLGQDNVPIKAIPDEDFLEFAKLHAYAKPEYAYETYLADQVKRYDWEEILDSFGRYLPDESTFAENDYISNFDPAHAMEQIFNSENYHAGLHALCMHFANYNQDDAYVAYIVQSLMCRVPEAQRDSRWNSRFNDIRRSASAAVTKKLHELAQETLPITDVTKDSLLNEKSIHDENWPLPFPDIRGACIPLDLLMHDFASSTSRPIQSFNYAAAFSFFTLCLQNIPIMPVMAERTANGCHLLLAPSTDGKDLSVSMPLKSLVRALKSGYLSETDFAAREVLQGLEPTGEITSLSAFQQWAESPWRLRGGIWINTECTSQIGKMSDENLNVANLAEVVVNIQDGTSIPTVTKAARKTTEQANISKPLHEAYSILFATQPASIKKFMTPGLLYKGVIGRFDYYISDQPPIPIEEQTSTLSADTLRKYTFTPKLLDFLAWMLKQCSMRRENCVDGYSRRVPVLYDDEDQNPFAMGGETVYHNGPRRQKHVDWDIKCKRNPNWQVDDPQFKTFIDRVPMSTERIATVLAAVQYLWECYLTKTIPFQEPIIMQDAVLDLAMKLGEYQYNVRFSRIWPLIGSTKGLDEKHKTVLEAIQKADVSVNKWLKFVSQNLRHAHKVLFDKEFYIPTRVVARLLPYDVDIATKDLIPILNTLHSIGLVELVASKQMDARIHNKPLKNLVRLTAEGRL